MPKKGFTAEQIVAKLRQIDILTGQGKAVPQACKGAGISDVSYYRWRKEYGGLKLGQAKKMKDLERENARLKRIVADLTLEKAMLKEVASGSVSAPSASGGRWRWFGSSFAFLNAPPAKSSASRG